MIVEQSKSDMPLSTPLGFSDKIKVLELAIKLFDQECDRMWKRYSVILTVNVLFVALLKFSGDKPNPLILILSAFLGLALCYCWRNIMIISRHYELRWQKDVIAIIESDQYLAECLRGRRPETSRDKRPFPQSSSSYATLIIWFLAIVWCCILIYGLVLEFR